MAVAIWRYRLMPGAHPKWRLHFRSGALDPVMRAAAEQAVDEFSRVRKRRLTMVK